MAWTYSGPAVELTYSLAPPGPPWTSGVPLIETTPSTVAETVTTVLPRGLVLSWSHLRMFVVSPSVDIGGTTQGVNTWPASDSTAAKQYADTGYTAAQKITTASCGSGSIPDTDASILYLHSERFSPWRLDVDITTTSKSFSSSSSPFKATCVAKGGHDFDTTWEVEYIDDYGAFDPTVAAGVDRWTVAAGDGTVKFGHPVLRQLLPAGVPGGAQPP